LQNSRKIKPDQLPRTVRRAGFESRKEIEMKIPTRRASSAVADHSSEIMISEDGTRRAFGRNVKVQRPNRRYDIVQAWRIRELVDGTWTTRATGLDKSNAEKFIIGGVDR